MGRYLFAAIKNNYTEGQCADLDFHWSVLLGNPEKIAQTESRNVQEPFVGSPASGTTNSYLWLFWHSSMANTKLRCGNWADK